MTKNVSGKQTKSDGSVCLLAVQNLDSSDNATYKKRTRVEPGQYHVAVETVSKLEFVLELRWC
jgi:hypothetical protein